MVTKKQVKKFIPKGAINLSMGKEFCAYMLNGEVVTLYYKDIFNKGVNKMDSAELARKTNVVIEHDLKLDPETMAYCDDFGNEYRDIDGSAIYYSDVLTNRLT